LATEFGIAAGAESAGAAFAEEEFRWMRQVSEDPRIGVGDECGEHGKVGALELLHDVAAGAAEANDFDGEPRVGWESVHIFKPRV
jgi:hypothetical protein